MSKPSAWVLLVMSALALVALAQPAQVRPINFDVEHSTMTVAVDKEGIFAFAGDTHQVDVPIVSGSFDPAGPSVELTIAAAKMQVQDPPSRRDKVQANMIGPQVLDVDRYPTIVFRSTKIDPTGATHWVVTGDLTLHGQTHPVTVQMTRADATHFSGSATVTQSDFGITPIKIAGGSVRVKDDVTVSFTIVLM